MSISGITGSLLSQIIGSSSTANQFAVDLNQLAGDLQSGNLSSAQQDYVTLSQDALNGTASSSTATTDSSGISTSLLSTIASSSSSSTSFVNELNQIGTDLSNNDLSSAQGDMLTLSATALNAASSTSSAAATSAGAVQKSNSADLQTDIQAILEAMRAGNTSAAATEMAQLATDAGNSSGASALQTLSGASSGSSSAGTTSATDQVTELLQSLNNSCNTSTSLNALA